MERAHSDSDRLDQSSEPQRGQHPDQPLLSAVQDVPLGVPYVPPPRRTGLAYALRRYAFVGACFALMMLVIAAFLFLAHPAPAPRPLPEGTSRPASAMPFRGTAALSVTSQPAGATVLLDRNPIGVTPLHRLSLSAGVHLLTVVKEGYAPYDRVVVLRTDTSRALRVNLRLLPVPRTARASESLAGTPVGHLEPQAVQALHPVPVESLVAEKTRQLSETLQKEKRRGTSRW